MGEASVVKNDFGWAIRKMKEGECVRRSGWDGKGMHVYLEDVASVFGGIFNKRKRTYGACLVMFTA